MRNYNVYGNIEEYLNSNSEFNIDSDVPYFPNTTERCIEIPYIFSKIDSEEKIADVGTSLADQVYFHGLTKIIKKEIEFHSFDIIPIDKVLNRFQEFDRSVIEKIIFHIGDIRNNKDNTSYFDTVLCVSVLEHIGFDKYLNSDESVFDRPFEENANYPDYYSWEEDANAINAMMALLKEGGRLLLTVPFGSGGIYSVKDSKNRYAQYLEFNKGKWKDLITKITNKVNINERFFFMNEESGWKEVDLADFENSDITYGIRTTADNGLLCAEIIKQS